MTEAFTECKLKAPNRSFTGTESMVYRGLRQNESCSKAHSSHGHAPVSRSQSFAMTILCAFGCSVLLGESSDTACRVFPNDPSTSFYLQLFRQNHFNFSHFSSVLLSFYKRKVYSCLLPPVTFAFAVFPAGGRGCVPGHCHCRPDQLPCLHHQGHEQERGGHHCTGQEERQVVLVLLRGDRGLSRLL